MMKMLLDRTLRRRLRPRSYTRARPHSPRRSHSSDGTTPPAAGLRLKRREVRAPPPAGFAARGVGRYGSSRTRQEDPPPPTRRTASIPGLP